MLQHLAWLSHVCLPDVNSLFLQLLNNDKLPQSLSDVPVCPNPPPVTTSSLPGVDPQLVIGTNPNKATRNFTCVGDLPSSYSDYLATLSDVGGNWWGQLFYDSNGFPTYSFVWQNPFEDYKQYPRTITTFKEYVEIPSPDGGAPWARYKVMKDTGNPPFAYVERANTVGGAPPGDCGNKDAVQVPYTATYNFYMCRDTATKPVAAPPTAPITPPMVTLSPPVVTASPPIIVIPTAAPPTAVTPVPAPAPIIVESPSPVPAPQIPVVTSPAAQAPPPSGVNSVAGLSSVVAVVAMVVLL